MNFNLAHANSVRFLKSTISNAEDVLDLATDHTPLGVVQKTEAAIKKAKETILRHKSEELSMRSMNELRMVDAALVRNVADIKSYERNPK